METKAMIMGRNGGHAGRLPGAAVVLAAALALAACGIKSSPKHPGDSEFPRQYPAKEDATVKTGTGAPAPRAPGGFPYEYPNQPPNR